MRKLFTFLLILFFASAFSHAVAQRNVLVWNGGYLKVVPSSSIDSVTFSVDKWLFRIKTSPAVGVTTKGFEATGSILLNENIKGLSETPTLGVCYSADHAQPTVSDRTVSLSSEYGTKTISVSGLMSGTTYYYRIYVTLLGETYYGNVCSVMTLEEEPDEHSKIINGHRFIDLGLPSGLLWAETNIGADNPEDAGNYYAWGETDTTSTYTYKDSKWFEIDHTDNLTATEDAATVNWGSGVRMPTEDDFKELRKPTNCTWTWTTKNGMRGYQVVSNANGSEIFLPAAGYRQGSGLNWHGYKGWYWSSTPNDAYSANDFAIESGKSYGIHSDFRYYGLTVRAVAE